ncbi:MAG: rhodanese-like domain-containing protein [Burkholderiales bacterium]|nr:rhodanese-like domain-containing protein [Pseudomonadota bacterium]
MQTIDPEQLKHRLDDSTRTRPLLLDVREPWEFELCHIEDARLLPMQQVPQQARELADDAEIVVICHHGLRSAQVVQFLMRNGFKNVANLQGGIDAWAERIDPAMRRY